MGNVSDGIGRPRTVPARARRGVVPSAALSRDDRFLDALRSLRMTMSEFVR
jgi:hypothetical protein